ncbi:MAG: helix-turn-helix domain-containing protein [Spirochaetota bacterium]
MGGKVPDIGRNIAAIRSTKNLSLDDLSKRSGVSKSMLSQIEQNKVNPTVATVWKIARAINVSIEKLIDEGGEKVFEIVTKREAAEMFSSDRSCRITILSPVHYIDKTELYSLAFKPRGKLISEPHFPGTEEIFSAIDGSFIVRTRETTAEVAAGDTVRYKADSRHEIISKSAKPSRGILLVMFHA